MSIYIYTHIERERDIDIDIDIEQAICKTWGIAAKLINDSEGHRKPCISRLSYGQKRKDRYREGCQRAAQADHGRSALQESSRPRLPAPRTSGASLSLRENAALGSKELRWVKPRSFRLPSLRMGHAQTDWTLIPPPPSYPTASFHMFKVQSIKASLKSQILSLMRSLGRLVILRFCVILDAYLITRKKRNMLSDAHLRPELEENSAPKSRRIQRFWGSTRANLLFSKGEIPADDGGVPEFIDPGTLAVRSLSARNWCACKRQHNVKYTAFALPRSTPTPSRQD